MCTARAYGVYLLDADARKTIRQLQPYRPGIDRDISCLPRWGEEELHPPPPPRAGYLWCSASDIS